MVSGQIEREFQVLHQQHPQNRFRCSQAGGYFRQHRLANQPRRRFPFQHCSAPRVVEVSRVQSRNEQARVSDPSHFALSRRREPAHWCCLSKGIFQADVCLRNAASISCFFCTVHPSPAGLNNWFYPGLHRRHDDQSLRPFVEACEATQPLSYKYVYSRWPDCQTRRNQPLNAAFCAASSSRIPFLPRASSSAN